MKKDDFHKKKLKNGLVVLFEKRNSSVVSVCSAVNYGSAFESEKIKGTAHFLEHLVFKGTKTRSQKQISQEIEKKGGILNAFTSEEVTSFWNKIPSKHLKTGIDVSSDLILNPKIEKTEFEKEKGVIIEEIKMYRDNPTRHSIDKIKELLYKKPFGMSIAGTEEIIRNVGREQVVNIHENVYSTDSMILCVVGNANFEEICSIAEKIFPTKKRNLIEHNPVKINRDEVEKRKGIDQAHFLFGFHSPTLSDEQKYSNEVALAYLTEGMSSRLFQEIREKRGLAYAVKGEVDNGKNYGYSFIYTGTVKEKINEIKKIILKEIKNLQKIQKSDLEEVKEQLIGLRKVEDEDSSNTMNLLVFEEIAGKAEDYYDYDKKILKVSLEDIRKISKIRAFSTFSLIPE